MTQHFPFVLAPRHSGLSIADDGSGHPLRLRDGITALPPLSFGIELETDGDEVLGVMGGVAYRGTRRRAVTRLRPETLSHTTNGAEDTFTVDADADGWLLRLTFAFGPDHPRARLSIAATPLGDTVGVLRNLFLQAHLTGELDRWVVEAPGNTLRTGVPASEISERVSLATAGYELGAPGLLAIHHAELPVTLVAWPMSRSEQGPISLAPSDRGLTVEFDTQLGGVVEPGEWIEHGPVHFDLVPETWDGVVAQIPRWYRTMGVSTPEDRPGWGATPAFFEVMVGWAPFRGGYRYEPYPTIADLIADLERIKSLGFDCIQYMPRHPYPSYNIHDPGDVTTTYGDPAELRELVAACHRNGLRIVLDILLHGVIDHDIMERTAELVRSGPHAHDLDRGYDDPYGELPVEISWSRHIIEFEPHWIAGSPEHHPLLDEHPEWFMRTSDGEVSSRYTHALDIANEEWQERFISDCESMVRDLGIDGFRFDAPFYNIFPNWSSATRRHASYSNLGYVRLFARLRPRLHAISPEVLLYTEPSGPLARESLDINYGYPERWLITSLFGPRQDPVHDWRRVGNGRELAAWFRDFDATLPPGSATAHFVDCHDTIWWRLPGDLWRREQIGLPATRAAIAISLLRGGGYLACAGAEVGVEDELRKALRLRRTLPEIDHGLVDYDGVRADSDDLYVLVRRDGRRSTLVAVNTAGHPVTSRVLIDTGSLAQGIVSPTSDVWNARPGPVVEATEEGAGLELALDPYGIAVIALGQVPVEPGEGTA